MSTRGLPPLLGTPWERQEDVESPASWGASKEVIWL